MNKPRIFLGSSGKQAKLLQAITRGLECFVADMTPIWEAARNHSVIEISESEYRGEASVEIDLPVEQVWDRLGHPEYRSILLGSDRQVRENKERLGQGDVYQCYHGDHVVPSVILEWLPFARMLTRDLIHVPVSTVQLLVDYTLAPTESGTVLAMACARPEGSTLARASFSAIAPTMMKTVEEALGVFKGRVETEAVLSASSPP